MSSKANDKFVQEPPRYLTARDLAARYQVSRNTIWGWSRCGNLPKPVKLGHACTRWLRSEVEAMERQKRATSQAGAA